MTEPTKQPEQPAPAAEPAAGEPTMEQLSEVAAAGAAAAEAGADPAPAMKEARDRAQLAMSDEDIDRIASSLNDRMIEGLRAAGAFDPLPEPVAPPAQPTAPPAPGSTPPVEAPVVEAPAPAPRKNFAQRYMGE